MNINALKAEIVRKGMNIKALAKEAGISRSILYLRLKSGNFRQVEISRISEVLNLDQSKICEIFFEPNVS